MTSNARCWKRWLAVLVLATIWLVGCTTVGSDVSVRGACPPVVEYSREFQARAAEELALLPEGSAVVAMLADYAVMRQQARVCGIFDACRSDRSGQCSGSGACEVHRNSPPSTPRSPTISTASAASPADPSSSRIVPSLSPSGAVSARDKGQRHCPC